MSAFIAVCTVKASDSLRVQLIGGRSFVTKLNDPLKCYNLRNQLNANCNFQLISEFSLSLHGVHLTFSSHRTSADTDNGFKRQSLALKLKILEYSRNDPDMITLWITICDVNSVYRTGSFWQFFNKWMIADIFGRLDFLPLSSRSSLPSFWCIVHSSVRLLQNLCLLD